jgi:FtsP/CotA-like multicopper oxidase with cupredoxin domain
MGRRLGIAVLLVAVTGLVISSWTSHRSSAAVNGTPSAPETFAAPPEITSEGGVLTATLTAGLSRIRVGSREVLTRVFNEQYLPPTLRVRPGDVIRLKLRNRIDQTTNLHYHGLNVSPRPPSDNIFLAVDPGQEFDYQIVIPPDHPSGLFWYHPHAHGLTEFQTYSGMSGGLIVEGLLDPFPALQGITERVMLLKDLQVGDDGQIPPVGQIDSNAGTTRTMNGQINPTLAIRPGEVQLWRIGNIGADIFYRLALDGHVFHEIARDGNRNTQLVTASEILLPPSSRVEVLVRGGEPGVYELRTLALSTGPDGDQYPDVTLATLVSEGPAAAPIALPTAGEFPRVDDLRGRPIDARRTFRFTENTDTDEFFINGRKFDMGRVDTVVPLGNVEEWTILNATNELHVFHIHQLDFQVVEIDGEPQPFVGHQDTVNMPLQRPGPDGTTVPGSVVIRIPFTNPVIAGRFVYHCHIMAHEDNGMMAVIEVTDGGGTAAPAASHQHGR